MTMTVRGDKYDVYKEALLAGGVSEAKAEDLIADAKAEDAKLDALICPKCSAPLTRTLDPRQAGPTSIAGKWFNYRCTKRCDWSFTDRCEPVGEN